MTTIIMMLMIVFDDDILYGLRYSLYSYNPTCNVHEIVLFLSDLLRTMIHHIIFCNQMKKEKNN